MSKLLIPREINSCENGFKLNYFEIGEVLPYSLQGHEHFGFHDNVSQPAVRGQILYDGQFI